MPATGADAALYTNNGAVVSSPDAATSAAMKAAHIDARDLGDSEIEMLWDNPNDAQVVLDERFSFVGKIDPLHEGIEVEETLGLGTTVPVAPKVPCYRAIDDTRNVDRTVRTRAYATDMSTDRFSVEVLE